VTASNQQDDLLTWMPGHGFWRILGIQNRESRGGLVVMIVKIRQEGVGCPACQPKR